MLTAGGRDEIERAASFEKWSLANMTGRILERWHAERAADQAAWENSSP